MGSAESSWRGRWLYFEEFSPSTVPEYRTVDLNPLSVKVAFRLILRAGAIPLPVCELAALFPSFVIDFRAGGNYWEKSESGYYCLP